MWRRSTNPYTDPTSIGNIAISKGYATREQIEFAIRKQEERLPLGMIMVDNGIITEIQLSELLIDQESKRKRLTPVEVNMLWRKEKRNKLLEVVGAFRGLSASLKSVPKG